VMRAVVVIGALLLSLFSAASLPTGCERKMTSKGRAQ
jgi:hypothetical protein